MKVGTLRKLFLRLEETKLFIARDDALVAGIARRPRVQGESLIVELSPSVRFDFASRSIVRDETAQEIRIDEETRMTRRIETHVRHARGRAYPMIYLKHAAELTDSKQPDRL